MADRFEHHLRMLRDLNVVLKHQLETAEAVIPEINELVTQIGKLGLAADHVLLGDVILRQPYLPGEGPCDSCQVCQAVPLVPQGIGLALWDSEEYAANRDNPNTDAEAQDAAIRFLPFAECKLVLKALLAPQAMILLSQLQRQLPTR